ncbi:MULTISPECIES: hypothetical protein [Streptomyces]|uniref:Uncharacterized protein n=2 Tax=Streptomyces TaxID=1883 RepID=A0A1E7LPL5_9ACTN|nr:hypothetical protein [Streptomyces nanshensis]OEV18154.1 hypothetical protein AN221_23720 [Streptomyces nanshensis]
MSKPNKKVLRLSTLRQSAEERGTADIPFEGVDGEMYSIPGPQFWPDSAHEAASVNDVPGMGRALLGEQYDAFTKGGNRSADLALVVEAYAEEQGVTLGESEGSQG